MKHCYINGIGCVSAQNSTDYQTFLDTNFELQKNVVNVYKPNYKDFIKPAMIRRMATGVKNGVVAASMALKDANVENPDAIITGTGMGCVVDSEKFLKNILDNDEQFLTPTAFIQSTHNTVGGQIALSLKCKAYNVTYVHGATSFESSLIDALLMINEEENILVGGVDEIGTHTTNMFKLINHVKPENVISKNILESNTKGVIFSEGAQFFSLSNQKNTNTYAQLVDVAIFDTLTEELVLTKLTQFLKENNITIKDIDLVILGNNGDVTYDENYKKLQKGVLKNTAQVYYKHLSGEYNTISAFGLWIASNICKEQTIPEILKLNNKATNSINNVLLYNQYRGNNHSFTLIKSC